MVVMLSTLGACARGFIFYQFNKKNPITRHILIKASSKMDLEV